MEGEPTYRRRDGSPILALVLAISGCVPYIGTTAASFLRKAQESPDPNIRHVAYGKLANPSCYESEAQKAEAVRVLVAGLQSDKEPVATHAVICRTLGELRDPGARAAMLAAVDDPDDMVRAEACRALGKVGKPEDATTLARIMTADPSDDCQVAAIEGLGELKSPDPRIDKMLVDGMSDPDPAIRLASLKALRSISGKDFGTEVGPWKEYGLANAKAKAERAKAELAKAAKPELTRR